MKLPIKSIAAGLLSLGLASLNVSAAGSTAGMQVGNPGIKSIGPLAFGPDGVLFAADTSSAAIFAIATGDTAIGDAAKRVGVEGLDQKIAALMGTTADRILINDLAVNPLSRAVYVAVSNGRSAGAIPVLVKVKADGALEIVSLDKVMYSKAALPDAPADKPVAQGERGTNPRVESITDIAFVDGKVVIAGLANEEFASTLRSVAFPFTTVAGGTTVEIYHGSHGQFETRAPVRTFVPFTLGKESLLIAAYTCTPLVEFPTSALAPGAKVRGQTIAELGNGNRPIDMIVYKKDGKDFLLLANSARGVMKIGIDGLGKAGSITSPVPQSQHDNLTVDSLAEWKGIVHLDKLDAGYAMVLEKTAGGAFNLSARALP